jgi:hypothetical protein
MTNVLRLLFSELVVITIGVLLISGAYSFVIPKYFHDQRTYSALIVGLALVAIASGYIARQAWLKARLLGWLFVASVSAGVTAVTLLLSLFFILNSRGS